MAREKLKIGIILLHHGSGSPGTFVRTKSISVALTKYNVELHIFSPFVDYWGDNIYFHKLDLVGSKNLESKSYSVFRKFLSYRFFNYFNPLLLKIMIKSLSRQISYLLDKLEIDVLEGEQELGSVIGIEAIKRSKSKPVMVSSLHNSWYAETMYENLCTVNYCNYIKKIENIIFNESDFITVPSKYFMEYLKHLGVEKPIYHVPLGGFVYDVKQKTNVSKFRIVHAGIIEPRENVELFINSIKYLTDYKNLEFYISNRGSHFYKIMQMAKRLEIPLKVYTWFEKYSDYVEFMMNSHIGIVTSKNTLPRKLGPATKMFDYMSFGLPIVGNNINSWSKLIREYQLGYLTNDDPNEFSEAIISIIQSPEKIKIFGNNGLSLIRNKYNWNKIGFDLYNIFLKYL